VGQGNGASPVPCDGSGEGSASLQMQDLKISWTRKLVRQNPSAESLHLKHSRELYSVRCRECDHGAKARASSAWSLAPGVSMSGPSGLCPPPGLRPPASPLALPPLPRPPAAPPGAPLHCSTFTSRASPTCGSGACGLDALSAVQTAWQNGQHSQGLQGPGVLPCCCAALHHDARARVTPQASACLPLPGASAPPSARAAPGARIRQSKASQQGGTWSPWNSSRRGRHPRPWRCEAAGPD